MIDDPDSRLPLLAQIEDRLGSEILAGTPAPGEQLPPEDQLVQRFGVSRTTIRAAVQNLIRRGLVEIRRGKGSYVTRPKITQELTGLTGFVEDMAAAGKQASATVLSRGLQPANEAVAAHLALPKGTMVMRIERVRLADGVPVSFDETYLPEALGTRVAAEDLATQPIFTLLEERFDTPLIEAEYRLEAVAADTAIAKALEIAPGAPIFRIERTSFTTGHVPVDYERLYYRGDHISFTTRLARRARSEG
jgi:GntR family transcriptional regulator